MKFSKMKKQLQSAQPAPSTRRKFLHVATAPVSSLLLAACGGGSSAADASVSPVTSQGAQPAVANVSAVAPVAPVIPVTPVTAAIQPEIVPTTSNTLPAWVAALPLWQWYEIPNTALSSVDPAVQPSGSTGPRSKIDAWCGACLKRRGSVYMLGAAGGHSDYAGNEVSALELNIASPRWTQLRGPSANTDIINGMQFYLDRRPSSTHTYYATQFIESLNRMVIFSSPGVSGPFATAPADFPYGGDKRSYSFNVAAGDWDGPDYVAKFPGDGDFTAALCVKHPLTNDVYYSKSYGSGWYRWTSASNIWTRLSSASRAPWYAGAAIDTLRNRMLLVGGYGSARPEVRNLDGAGIAAAFTGLGVAALTLGGYPAVIYDEATDRYLVAFNSDNFIKILRVHPETWFVDEPPMTGTAPAARMNGLQNSMQFVPELRGLVLANKHSGNVFFARTAA